MQNSCKTGSKHQTEDKKQNYYIQRFLTYLHLQNNK